MSTSEDAQAQSAVQVRSKAARGNQPTNTIDMPNGALSVFSFLAASVRSKDSQFGVFDEDAEEDSSSEDEGEDEDLAGIPADPTGQMPSVSNTEKFQLERTIIYGADNQDAGDDGVDGDGDGPHHSDLDHFHNHEENDSHSHIHDEYCRIVHQQRRHSTLESSIHTAVFRADDHDALSSDEDEDGTGSAHNSHISKTSLSNSKRSVQRSRANALSDKLRQQLGIGDDEVLIGDYPCWFLKNVLLQGHLYLTSEHISFFAYLPRGPEKGIMSGTLRKKSRKTPTYNRYWFVLRNDAFSYFVSSTDLYFPSGTIDLRYAINAEIVAGKNEAKSDSHTFIIVTETRKYTFKADTPKSARDWVSSLQKEIFRSRNEGDSVKIVIPTVNVIDLEQSSVISLVTSLKIRAIENDESFAVDEYVFAFFNRSREACRAIRRSLKEHGVSNFHRKTQEAQKIASERSILEGIVDSTVSPGERSKRLPEVDEEPGHLSRASSSRSLSAMIKHIPRLGNKSPRAKSRLSDSKDIRPTLTPTQTSGSQTPAIGPTDSSSIKSASVIGEVEKQLEKLTAKDDAEQQVSHAEHSDPIPPELADVTLITSNQFVKDRTEEECSGGDESDLMRRETDNNLDVREQTSSDEDRAAYEFLSASESKKLENEGAHSEKSNPHHFYTPAVVTKVTEMWGGGRKHFSTPEEPEPYHFDRNYVTSEAAAESNNRYRAHFSVGDNLVASYYCHIQKAFPVYGKLYLSNNYLCYRSLIPGVHTKMILPLSDIENVTKEKGFRFGYSGLVLVIGGHEEVFFEFGSSENRDDCEMMILREIDRFKKRALSFTGEGSEEIYEAKGRAAEARTARWVTRDDQNMEVPVLLSEVNDPGHCPLGDMDVQKLPEGTLFTLLTIGSRGDVQPYIALGKGLLKEGYRVRIATHKEFGPWIEKYNMEFREIAGDPGQLMKIMIDHGMLSVAFIREATTKFKTWIDELLVTSWEACQGTDVLIEAPSAMGGIHIAEALKIPYFRSFTMPWTRTRSYPHAFIVPEQKMGGSYNYLTYVMFDNVFWKGISGQVNKWRQKKLKIGRTSLLQMHQNSVPFLYSVSPQVLVPPVDYSDWVKVSGYWFLDEGSENYEPPEDLAAFIKKARDDDKKLIYIGFGSIVVSNPEELTKTVVSAVEKAGVRCVLAKGWSDRLDSADKNDIEIELPPEIFSIKAAPHDWLFPQLDAAVHHGGSGTTGASLRAGLPTVIKPFFADQFFYAGRVEDLGVGINLKKLNDSQLSKAIWEVTHNERIIAKAGVVGNAIRNEDGVGTAIKFIHGEMDYCKSLIEKKEAEKNNRNLGLLSAAAGLVVSGAQQPKSALTAVLRGRSRPSSRAGSIQVSRSNSPSHESDKSDKSEQSWTLLEGSTNSVRSNLATSVADR